MKGWTLVQILVPTPTIISLSFLFLLLLVVGRVSFRKDFQIGLGLKNDVWNGWWQRISGPIQLTAALISCVTHYDFFSNLQGVPKSLGNPSLGRLLSFKHVNVILTSTMTSTSRWRNQLTLINSANFLMCWFILLTFLDESNLSAQTCLDTL